jgi:RNA polymerase sigma-70 factor (ECF subfamily)
VTQRLARAAATADWYSNLLVIVFETEFTSLYVAQRSSDAGKKNFFRGAALDGEGEIWQVAAAKSMSAAEMLDSFGEARLLARIAKKDAEAFAQFYDQTSGVLFSVAKSILLDATKAEDVLQEIYLTIWEKADVYDPALGKPISWAIALTRNKALDLLRSTKRRDAALQRLAGNTASDASDGPPPNVEMKESAEIVRQALATLGEKQRRAIELSLLGGLAHAEIAQMMGEPLGTVKAWIRRGILEIREQLQNYE